MFCLQLHFAVSAECHIRCDYLIRCLNIDVQRAMACDPRARRAWGMRKNASANAAPKVDTCQGSRKVSCTVCTLLIKSAHAHFQFPCTCLSKSAPAPARLVATLPLPLDALPILVCFVTHRFHSFEVSLRFPSFSCFSVSLLPLGAFPLPLDALPILVGFVAHLFLYLFVSAFPFCISHPRVGVLHFHLHLFCSSCIVDCLPFGFAFLHRHRIVEKHCWEARGTGYNVNCKCCWTCAKCLG